MTKETLCWAVFVAILTPLFLRTPADPAWFSVTQIALAFGLVALADQIERNT